MIIGITGLVLNRDGDAIGTEGAGKTTVAEIMASNGRFALLGCSDLIKRVAVELFGFTSTQAFGPAAVKDVVDARFGFSPRFALQRLGTEVGRSIYENAWIDYTLRTARKILDGWQYDPALGLLPNIARPPIGVILHDIRFPQ
jgi:hypothetical protein